MESAEKCYGTFWALKDGPAVGCGKGSPNTGGSMHALWYWGATDDCRIELGVRDRRGELGILDVPQFQIALPIPLRRCSVFLKAVRTQ